MGRLTWIALLLLAGCRYRPEPVLLRGDPNDLRALAGKWDGVYSGLESGRAGNITFEITANADSAFGEVLLTIPGDWGPVFPVDLGAAHLEHARSAQTLNVQFVRIAGGQVRGTLEPYRAPDCSCVVHTVFTGSVVGDRILGSFVTILENGREQHGTWQLKRKKE